MVRRVIGGRTAVGRHVGDRYECQECGARLVYEKECPCPPEMEHNEICCEKPMVPVPATS